MDFGRLFSVLVCGLSLGALAYQGISAKVLPKLPDGLNSAYRTAANQVEKSLGEGDFESALENAALLPRRKIRYSWNDSSVPTDSQVAVCIARDLAFGVWKEGVQTEFVEGAPADINFTFLESLPKRTVAFGTDLPSPRLKVQIPARLKPEEVQNEVGEAISQYLGLEAHTGPLQESQFALAREALDLAGKLRALTSQQEQPSAGLPQMELESTKLEGLKGVQAMPMNFAISVTNKGSAPLALYVKPDCGCFSPTSPPVLKPGETGKILADVDTVGYIGKMTHYLMVYSNDPNQAFVEIPVDLHVAFTYRFVQPGATISMIGENGADAEVYLLLSQRSEDLKIKSAQVAGSKATVTYAPWQGDMGDLSIGEPVLPRKGYLFKVHLDAAGVQGRIPVALAIQTDSAQFPELRKNLFFQRGIVAEPSKLYMGEVSAQPRQLLFTVDKGGQEFKVLSVESGHPSLSVNFRRLDGPAKYRFEVNFNGKVNGKLATSIKVHTDDVKQPLIEVPVEGVVR